MHLLIRKSALSSYCYKTPLGISICSKGASFIFSGEDSTSGLIKIIFPFSGAMISDAVLTDSIEPSA